MMMKDDLNKPLLYSALIHVSVILFLSAKTVFFPEAIDIYQSALRVDIVDLPDKIFAEDKATSDKNAPAVKDLPEEKKNEDKVEEKKEVKSDPKIESKVEEKKEEKPDLVLKETVDKNSDSKASKETSSDAIAKLKKEMAVQKIMEEMKQKEREELSKRVLTYKGNVIAPGTELKGVNKLQEENYLRLIDQHVKKHWSLPEWLARGDYKAQVKLFIDEKGFVLKSELINSSGNSSYDEIVLETVRSAAPYPVPPEKFQAIVSVNGIILGFPE